MIDKNVNVYYGRNINKAKDIQYFAGRILQRLDCSCRYSNSSVVKAAAAVRLHASPKLLYQSLRGCIKLGVLCIIY